MASQTVTIDPPADVWAIVEIMGHARYAGRISECQQFGTPLIRVEVPEVNGMPAFEKHFGAASIFAITPVSEEVARSAAARFQARPISILDMPMPRLSGPSYGEQFEDDDEEEIEPGRHPRFGD